MIILDTLLIGGIKFVLGKIAAAVESELNDDSVYREELLAAQMKLELGEITEDEFADIERDVIAAIRELKGARQGPISMSPQDKVTGVDIQSFDEDR